ncbi:MAG: ABC-type multidrug transport system, ATPase and permease component, partial [Acidimicrobiales bacterium]|nr:ABC-type multidrug transport system, ATPase and permease component [Acidimicrobiales bacterium]
MSDPPAAPPSGWRLLLASARESWRGLAIGVMVGLIWTAAKVSVPRLAQYGIDAGIRQDDGHALSQAGLLILAAGVVAATCSGFRRWNAFRVSRWVETDLRRRLFEHLTRLHFGYHDKTPTGQLMSRANTDLQQIQFFFVMIPLTLSNAVTVLAVTVILFSSDADLALLSLCALPLVNVLAKKFSTRLHPEVMGLQQELAELAEVVEETVSGIRVVKGHGAERTQARRLESEADDVLDRSVATARVRATYLPALELLPTLGLVAVLWYGGHQVLRGDMEVGQLVAFNAYLLMLVWPLRSTGMIVALAQRAAAAGSRVGEVLSTEPEIASPPAAAPLPAGGGELRFEGVRFAYAPGAPVLEDLDLVVAAGTSLALVGPTASGKSTIARLIPRFYDVTGGRVLLDGADVRDVRLPDLRRAVATVFEETFLFSDTIRANIAFANPEASDADVERAARLAGVAETVAALPEGYDSVVGERGYSLSGGQRQRIAIARAVLADPRLLILDDATSAVDPTKEHEIRDALAEVMAGRTTLVIAHRPATIALADRVALLDSPSGRPDEGSRIVATG